MDATLLMVALVAFLALIGAWLTLPASSATEPVMPTRVVVSHRSAARA